MNSFDRPHTGPGPAETPSERAARLAWESARIDEALADVAAGRIVSEEQFDAWIDSIGTANELPLPRSGR